MNRSELITLLQIERGLRIASCCILASEQTRSDGTPTSTGERLHHRTFTLNGEYPKLYSYKVPAKMQLGVDDLVVLPVRDGELVIGRVHKIHTDLPDGVDLSKNRYNLRYILGVIDPTLHDMAVAEEKAAETQMQKVEVRQKLVDYQKVAGIDLDQIRLPSLAKDAPDESPVVDTEDTD